MKNACYLVAGLGKTGLSIARYLKRRHCDFIVFDTRDEPLGMKEFTAEFPEISVYLKDFPLPLLSEISAIISSPGVPLDLEIFQKAKEKNIPVYGDIECLAKEIQVPVIAITGTNGKSTVTSLVGEMAKAAGFNAAIAGNIGTPVLDLLNDGNAYNLWVLELSSFQLDLTDSLRSLGAAILNITPDHLDRHYSLAAYKAAKQRIYHHAKKIVYNRDDEATKPSKEDAQGKSLISFGVSEPLSGHWGLRRKDSSLWLAYGEECLLAADSIRIKGVHNWQNALAACALAEAAGISPQYMVSVLKEFAGLPHRCEWVKTLGGVEWVNDSKGTNVGATVSAVSGIGGSMQGKIVLIAGGQGKGADFSDLQKPIGEHVRAVVLIGEDAEKIAQALTGVVPVLRAKSLDNAVDLAKTQAKPGDVVLLSPACASFDMFNNFNHRGEVFKSLVNRL